MRDYSQLTSDVINVETFYIEAVQSLWKEEKVSFFIQISNIYLGLGFEFEFGLQKIRDLAIVSPQSVDQRLKIQFDHRICSLWRIKIQSRLFSLI